MGNAVQLQFGKPDTAESGEAALEMASSKIYDVIFLDVLMSDMEGLAACTQIHETAENESTPIVFVTRLADAASREQALLCGGTVFITKPVLPAEASLQALTFAVHNRLENCLTTSS